MLSLSRRTVIATAMVGSAAVAVPAVLAAGGSNAQPANKAVAAGSHLQVLSDNQTQTILSATFKTSKPEDLLMTVSLECSILTALTTNNDNPSADARSGVRAWLTLDGKVVPVQDASAPPQNPGAGGDAATDGVNFCDREYSRMVTTRKTRSTGSTRPATTSRRSPRTPSAGCCSTPAAGCTSSTSWRSSPTAPAARTRRPRASWATARS